MLIDTHAHYSSSRFNKDRDQLLASLPAHNITAVINVGYDLSSSQFSVELAKKYDYIYAAVGIHPHDATAVSVDALNTLRALAKNQKVVAVGEIGLDYYRDLSPRNIQQAAFRAQLDLARELNLPAIIHDRDAHGDALAIIKEYNDFQVVFHCYAGSAEMAKELVKRGHMISFLGNITYDNPKRAYESALAVGLPNIMVETDCPYMTPQPQRGKRCDSAMLKHTVAQLAQWFNKPQEKIAEITTANARNFFDI